MAAGADQLASWLASAGGLNRRTYYCYLALSKTLTWHGRDGKFSPELCVENVYALPARDTELPRLWIGSWVRPATTTNTTRIRSLVMEVDVLVVGSAQCTICNAQWGCECMSVYYLVCYYNVSLCSPEQLSPPRRPSGGRRCVSSLKPASLHLCQPVLATNI